MNIGINMKYIQAYNRKKMIIILLEATPEAISHQISNIPRIPF